MTDDDLLLYYYDDGLDPAERRSIAEALASDAELAERYRRLCRELGGLPDPAVAPPSADVIGRWRSAFDRHAGPEPRRPGFPGLNWTSFLFGAAVTAALAIGIGIGVFVGGGAPQPVPDDLVARLEPQASDVSSTFLRGLKVHFRDSRAGLMSLQDDGSDRLQLIMQIVEQNRLFERAAVQNDADQLARVLRAFDLVLVELASDEIAPAEADALRAKLLFELDVMLTKLSRPSSDGQERI